MGRYLGIDPGTTGAIALLSGKKLRVVDTPSLKVKKGKRNTNQVDAYSLAGVLKMFGRIDHAFVEKVGANPVFGRGTLFTFGRSIGVIEGVLATLGIPVTFIAPREWQKGSRIVGKDKDQSRKRAMELWPRKAKRFKRKKDNGRSDAALIARYGRRLLSV